MPVEANAMARILIVAVWMAVIAPLGTATSAPADGPATKTADAKLPATGPAETEPAATRPATEPAETRPAEETETQPTETQPAEPPPVKWFDKFEAAAADAKQRDVPVVVVYLDPDAPAGIMLDEEVLTDRLLRAFLADVAAVKLNATVGAGKMLFEKTGAKEAPLTQVLAPDGELLDSIPGAIVPAEAYRDRLARATDYWRASRVKPFDEAARFKAVQARLKLSTRTEAAKDIETLLKLPPGKLPEGVTPARLHVAAGLAAEKSEQAGASFEKAIELGPKDAHAAGRAMLELGRIAAADKKYKDARARFQQYTKEFPDGPDRDRAWYDLAMADYAIDGPAQAIKTLEEFIKKYPDDPGVVVARKLLDGMKMLDKKDAKK